jgi:Fe-S-cluster-containing dehydrogenase component
MTAERLPTRRRFLAQAAATAGAVVALGVVVVLPRGTRASTKLSSRARALEDHKFVYLIDTRRCIGCGSCVQACRAENDVPERYFRTWIERYQIAFENETTVDSPDGGERGFPPTTGGGDVRKSFFVPKICNHCEDTPCTQVCPVGAAYTSPEGVVLVDKQHCIGCGYCVQACPYGSRFINPVTHTADKCTLCYHRITSPEKLPPACVAACPTGARRLGNRKDPEDPVNEILATERVMVLQPTLLTRPQCFYLGLDMEVR